MPSNENPFVDHFAETELNESRQVMHETKPGPKRDTPRRAETGQGRKTKARAPSQTPGRKKRPIPALNELPAPPRRSPFMRRPTAAAQILRSLFLPQPSFPRQPAFPDINETARAKNPSPSRQRGLSISLLGLHKMKTFKRLRHQENCRQAVERTQSANECSE